LATGAESVADVTGIGLPVPRLHRHPPTRSRNGHANANNDTNERTIVLSEAAQRDAGIVLTQYNKIQSVRLEAQACCHLMNPHARIGSLVEGQIVSVSAQIGDRVTLGQHSRKFMRYHHEAGDYRKAVADRQTATK